MNHHCAVSEEDLGPYLLGQLSPGAADEVAAQVSACPSCSEEVARLRPVVAALAAGSAPQQEDAGPAAVPRARLTAAPDAGPVLVLADDGLAAVLSSVRRERRVRTGRRVAVAVGGLAAAVAVGAAGALYLPQPGDSREVSLARADTAPQGTPDTTATMVLSEQTWGTAIELRVDGLSPDETYGVWLERREGGRLPAGSFQPDEDGTVRLSLGSALALGDSGAVGVALLPGGVTADAIDVLAADL